MRQEYKRFVAACLISFFSGSVASMHAIDGNDSEIISECARQLHALIAYHQVTASLEGESLDVKWISNEEAILYHDAYSQHVWCQDDEMHIAFGDETRW